MEKSLKKRSLKTFQLSQSLVKKVSFAQTDMEQTTYKIKHVSKHEILMKTKGILKNLRDGLKTVGKLRSEWGRPNTFHKQSSR
jgi:hypothetical protein